MTDDRRRKENSATNMAAYNQNQKDYEGAMQTRRPSCGLIIAL